MSGLAMLFLSHDSEIARTSCVTVWTQDFNRSSLGNRLWMLICKKPIHRRSQKSLNARLGTAWVALTGPGLGCMFPEINSIRMITMRLKAKPKHAFCVMLFCFIESLAGSGRQETVNWCNSVKEYSGEYDTDKLLSPVFIVIQKVEASLGNSLMSSVPPPLKAVGLRKCLFASPGDWATARRQMMESVSQRAVGDLM